jgi:Tfp pilus assembly protein PilF
MRINSLIATATCAALAACGGGGASGVGKGATPPPPPNISKTEPGKPEPKREISKDEKKDYESAMSFFNTNDKGGNWSDSACRDAAERFTSVVRSHSNSVEGQYMVGLSYHRCGMLKEAEAAYRRAVEMNPKHGASLSNLGEIYYRDGKGDIAKQYWDNAIKANGKLVAARNNVASWELDQIRRMGEKDPKWKDLEADARFNLSNVLGVDSENVKAYTLYGLVYMEGFQKNKNRLDLAKLLLDEAKKRNDKYAPLHNAYGLFYMHRNALSEALQNFQTAVELDPKFVEARMNVGLTTLGFRKYDVAKEQFTKVLELAPKNYDAMIGLGVALRGLKDFEGAEATYKKALSLDSKRGEAYYNLAVLAKDFRATKQPPQDSIATYKAAQGYFRDFISKGGSPQDMAEAKEQIALIDKTITSTQKFLEAQAKMPKQDPTPPPTPPTPPAGGDAPAPAPGGAPPAAPAPAPKK